MKEKDINSLDHTSWRCQYHIVFAPKYRRQVIYREIKVDIGKILRKLCDQKGVEIIEAELCPDHVHMLVSIPPNLSVSQFVGYLKGKSSLMIFDRHANLKYKYGNRHFWCRGYYVDTVGKNTKIIEEYINGSNITEIRKKYKCRCITTYTKTLIRNTFNKSRSGFKEHSRNARPFRYFYY